MADPGLFFRLTSYSRNHFSSTLYATGLVMSAGTAAVRNTIGFLHYTVHVTTTGLYFDHVLPLTMDSQGQLVLIGART